MARYIGQRLILLLVTLWLISTLTFVLMHSIPGDPFSSEKKLPEQTLRALEAKYNLDKPLPQQYVLYMKNLATGDLGISIKTPSRSVNEILSAGFPVSARLGLQAIVIASFAGVIMGMIAAIRQNRPTDYILMVVAVLGLSIPNFVLGPLMQKYLGLEWEIFPIASWGDGFGSEFQYTVLPSIALSFLPLALVTRLMRSSMLDVLGQDYIRTARAKGLPPLKVFSRHTLRNAIIPVVTILGPITINILTGSFVIEKIFSIPGIGKYFVDSISNRDYSVIMGVTIFYSALLVMMNFVVDLLYGLIDPRIKLGAKEGN